MLQEILNCILLGSLSFCDLRSRTIPALPCPIYAAAGLIWQCVQAERRAVFLAVAFCVSALFVLFALLLRKVWGSGDFLAVWACLSMSGFGEAMSVAFLAIILAGIYAAGLVLLKKAGRRDSFPFVPFLFVSQVLHLALSMIG